MDSLVPFRSQAQFRWGGTRATPATFAIVPRFSLELVFSPNTVDENAIHFGNSSLDYKKLACGDKKIEGLIFFDRWRQLAIVNQDGSNRLILRQFNRTDFAVDFLND